MKKVVLNRTFIVLMWLLLLVGAGLRCHKLFQMPGGLLNCNAIDLNIALKAFSEKNFPLFVPLGNLDIREGLHSYIQHLLPPLADKLLDSHKLYALLLVFLCALLLFYMVKLTFDKETAFYSNIMLLLSFWHIYPSRILGNHNGVVLLILLSSLVFLKILKLTETQQFKDNKNILFRWLTLILFINVIGFFYFASFRIVILTQLIVALLLHKRCRIAILTTSTTFALGIASVSIISIFNGLSLQSVIDRGSRYLSQNPDFNPFLNIGYSILMPIVKAPADLFNMNSTSFSPDCISQSFFDASPLLISGFSYTGFYLLGLIIVLYKTWLWLINDRKLSNVNIYLIYGSIFYLLFVLIIGIAGPSYTRLLPLSLVTAVICGIGIKNVLYFIKNIDHKFLSPLAVLLFITALSAIPLETFHLIKRANKSDAVVTWFNKKTVDMLERIKVNKAYNKRLKYVICPHNIQVCKFYAHSIPNLIPVRTIHEIKSHVAVINGFENKKDKKNKKKEKVHILWPDYNPYAANYIRKPNQTVFHPNLNSEFIYKFDVNIVAKSFSIAGKQEINDYKGQKLFNIITVRL